MVMPAIADYEVRRALVSLGATGALRRLDALADRLVSLPLTTITVRRASSLGADLRRAGQPTGDPHALDGDVILAEQAPERDTRTAASANQRLTRRTG